MSYRGYWGKNSPAESLSADLDDIEAAQNSVLAGHVAWIGVLPERGVSKPNMINFHSKCVAEFWLIVALRPDWDID